MKTVRKILAGFSLSFVVELLSLFVVVTGLILMVQACSAKKIVSDTSYKETNTRTSDTLREDVIINKEIKGAAAENSGQQATQTIRDSVVIKYNIKDSVVYKVKYRDVVVPVNNVDHPPVFAYHTRGYAKAYMEKGKLFVFFNLYPYVLTDTLKGAKTTINNTDAKTIDKSNTVETTNQLSVGNIILSLLFLIVVSVVIRILWPLFKSHPNI